MSCRSFNLAGCLGTTLIGLVALASLISTPSQWLSLGGLLLALTLVSFKLSARGYYLWLAASAVSIASSLILGNPLPFIAVLALALPLLGPIGLLASVAAPSLSYMTGYAYTWVLSAASILGASLYIAYSTRRIHSIAPAVAALAPLFGPTEAGLAAVLTVSVMAVASTRLVEESGCPFKTENRLVIAGGLISGAGLLLLATGWSPVNASLWLLGLLLLEAGALAPRESSPSQSS